MKNEKTIKKCIYVLKILSVIIWMITVFHFSSQVGEDSSNVSGNFIKNIILLFNPNIEIQELNCFIEILQPFIRKLAHFTIYTIGGILIYNLNIDVVKKNTKNRILFSFIFGVLYAISDEVHQLFVPGRGGRIFDVAIDSSGVITGICIYIIMEKIILKLKKRKQLQ